MSVPPNKVIRVYPPQGTPWRLANLRDHPETGAVQLTAADLSCTTAERTGCWMGYEMVAGFAADHGEVADEAAMLALHNWAADSRDTADYHYVAPGDSCTRADDPGYRWHCLRGHGHYLTDWERRPLGITVASIVDAVATLTASTTASIAGLEADLDGKQPVASALTALAGIDLTGVGLALLTAPAPTAARLLQVNADGSVSYYNPAASGIPSGGYPGYMLTYGLGGVSWSAGATPSGAWSIRKVFDGHAGACIRLQRSSDSAEADFGFSGGWLDTSAVAAWAGSANLYVSRVYNQFGGPDLVYHNSRPPFVLNRSATSGYSSWEVSSACKMACTIDSNGVGTGIMGGVVAPIGAQATGSYQTAAAVLYWPQSAGWGTVSVSITNDEIAWRWGSGQSVSGNSRARTATNGLSACVAAKTGTEERIWLNGAQLGATATGRAATTAGNSASLQVGGGSDGDTYANAYVCELIYYRLADLTGSAYTAAAATAYGLS